MEERFIRFSLFSSYPELVCGISNRAYGDMRFGVLPPEEIIKNREQFFADLGIESSEVIVPNQVHGSHIKIVGNKEKGRGASDSNTQIAEADGLITNEKGIFLMIKTADCLPILIYDPVKMISGAVHAGWRGVLDQIVSKAINKFINLGSSPEDLVVAIGPSICQKHFIVKNSVLKHFLATYPSAAMVRNLDGYVDLKKAVTIDLKKLNIIKENIEASNYCTVCNNSMFGSFRKEGTDAPEIASIIGMR